MNAPLATTGNSLPALSMDENQLIQVLENSLYPGANPNSIALVINYCRASQLDPMQKPVHIVPIWDSKAGCMRDVIMPGIGLYRTQAARSGSLAGVSEPEFGDEVTEIIGGVEIKYPRDCRVTVKRILPDGTVAEFTAREFWKENYAVKGGKEKSIAPNAMWSKRPYAQLAKCAQAQALRIAFPEIGSQPTADEMEGKELSPEFEGVTVDGTTGKVDTGITMPQSKGEQPAAAPASTNSELASEGELNYLRNKCKALCLVFEDVAAANGYPDITKINKDGFIVIKDALLTKERG